MIGVALSLAQELDHFPEALRRPVFAVGPVPKVAVVKQRHLDRIPSGFKFGAVPFSGFVRFEAEAQFAGQGRVGRVLVRIDQEAEIILLLGAFAFPAVVPIEAPALDSLARRGRGKALGIHGRDATIVQLDQGQHLSDDRVQPVLRHHEFEMIAVPPAGENYQAG